MANIRQKRAAHAKRRAELKERKRERAANRAMLEAKGIDTSAAQHGPKEFPVTITITDETVQHEIAPSWFTEENLLKQSKADLAPVAQSHGMVIKSKTTKQQMVDHILASTNTAEAA